MKFFAGALAMFLAMSLVTILEKFYLIPLLNYFKRNEEYSESNYMRSRKNQRDLRRYGDRLADHERRLLKVEGFGR